jgi:aldehyde dehydrogenase (NAD+)
MDYKLNIQFRKETLTRLLYSIEENETRIIDALYKDFKKPEFEAVLTETNYVIADLKQTIKNLKCWANLVTLFTVNPMEKS